MPGERGELDPMTNMLKISLSVRFCLRRTNAIYYHCSYRHLDYKTMKA